MRYKQIKGIIKVLNSNSVFNNGDTSGIMFDPEELKDPYVALGQVYFDFTGANKSYIEILYKTDKNQSDPSHSRNIQIVPSQAAKDNLNGPFLAQYIDPILNIIFPELASQDWKE